jgi:hypothetical protein
MGTPATLGQAVHILTLISQKNGDKDDLTALVQSGLLADLLIAPDVRSINRDEFRKLIGLKPLVPDRIILPIDYTKSLEQMIVAGNYDWKNDDLTAQRFPIVGEGVVEYEFRYFHFNRNVSSETAVDLIKKEDSENPWEPAKIEHLLTYGENIPEEQRKFSIVALGSVGEVYGLLLVPCLYKVGSMHHLSLGRWVGDWHGRYRFLVVRKVTRTSVS